eukprot:403334047
MQASVVDNKQLTPTFYHFTNYILFLYRLGLDCTGKSYPFFIGDGITADAKIFSFDISETTSNIIFGGHAYYDSTIIDKPMVGFFKESTQKVEWIYYYYGTTMETVKAVQFDNNEDFLYAATINNFKLYRIETATGNIVQSWQQNIGQPDVVYFTTLIIDIRNQPIVGLCGFSLLYECDYKVVSYGLTPTNINWAKGNADKSNPRSFFYEPTTDVLYIGGHEYYLLSWNYLLLLKKNAQTGSNMKEITLELSGAYENLDIKSLQAQADIAYGCLALKTAGTVLGFIAYDFGTNTQNIQTMTTSGAAYDCIGTRFNTNTFFMIYTKVTALSKELYYAQISNPMSASQLSSNLISNYFDAVMYPQQAIFMSDSTYLIGGYLKRTGPKALGFVHSNLGSNTCGDLMSISSTPESSSVFIYFDNLSISKYGISVGTDMVQQSLCVDTDPFKLSLKSGLQTSYVGQAGSSTDFAIGQYFKFDSGCPLLTDFTYQIWNTDTNVLFTSLDSQTFDSTNFKLSVSASSFQSGTYNIKLKMFYKVSTEVLPQYQFQLIISSDPCAVQTLATSQKLDQIYLYTIGAASEEKILTFEEFTKTPVACTEIISYSLTCTNCQNGLLPYFMIYALDSVTNKYQLKVLSSNNSDSGTYFFTFKAQLTTSVGVIVQKSISSQFQLIANLTILSLLKVLPQNSLPDSLLAFDKKISQLNVVVASSDQLIGAAQDTTPPMNLLMKVNDTAQVYSINAQCSYEIESVKASNSVPKFVRKNSDNSLIINPTKATDVGGYQIQLAFDYSQKGCINVKEIRKMTITVIQKLGKEVNNKTSSQNSTFSNNFKDVNLTYVSFQQELDDLKVTVLSNVYFQSAKDMLFIKPNSNVQSQIPRQITNSQQNQNLQAFADVAKSTVQAVISSNIATQVFSGFSMQQVWDLVNLFQLIIHLDMLQLSFPENMQIFLSCVVDLVNLKILPTDQIVKFFQEKVNFEAPSFVDVESSFENSQYDGQSAVKNIIGIASLFFGMIALFFVLNNQHKINYSEKFAKQFNSILDNLDTQKLLAFLLPSIYFMRRLIYVIIIIFAKQSIHLQLLCQIIISMIIIIYLLKVKPLKTNWQNKVELFNEFNFLLINYSMYTFTEINDDPQVQINVGWVMVLILGLLFTVNLFIALLLFGKQIKDSIVTLIHKCKSKFRKQSSSTISINPQETNQQELVKHNNEQTFCNQSMDTLMMDEESKQKFYQNQIKNAPRKILIQSQKSISDSKAQQKKVYNSSQIIQANEQAKNKTLDKIMFNRSNGFAKKELMFNKINKSPPKDRRKTVKIASTINNCNNRLIDNKLDGVTNFDHLHNNFNQMFEFNHNGQVQDLQF